MAVALLPVIGSTVGCGGGDGLPRQAVSGTVAFNGKPLKSGVITFVPGSPEITTQGGAPVAEGRYEISKDVGLVPGKYKVSISSGEGSAEKKVDK